MALTPETFRDLETDIKDIGESGNLDKIIYPRYGAPYNSVPRAIRLMMETGGWKAYQTEAALLATTPTVNPSVSYAFDTKKLYLWNGTSWIDEGLSQLDQAKHLYEHKRYVSTSSFKAGSDSKGVHVDTNKIFKSDSISVIRGSSVRISRDLYQTFYGGVQFSKDGVHFKSPRFFAEKTIELSVGDNNFVRFYMQKMSGQDIVSVDLSNNKLEFELLNYNINSDENSLQNFKDVFGLISIKSSDFNISADKFYAETIPMLFKAGTKFSVSKPAATPNWWWGYATAEVSTALHRKNWKAETSAEITLEQDAYIKFYLRYEGVAEITQASLALLEFSATANVDAYHHAIFNTERMLESQELSVNADNFVMGSDRNGQHAEINTEAKTKMVYLFKPGTKITLKYYNVQKWWYSYATSVSPHTISRTKPPFGEDSTTFIVTEEQPYVRFYAIRKNNTAFTIDELKSEGLGFDIIVNDEIVRMSDLAAFSSKQSSVSKLSIMDTNMSYRCPSRSIGGVVTFIDDDGRAGFYNELYPLIKLHKIPFGAAVSPGLINKTGYMTLNQLLEVNNNPALVEILSHSWTHAGLNWTQDEEAIKREVSSTKNWFVENGIAADSFAYPYGADDARTHRLVSQYFTASYDYAEQTVVNFDTIRNYSIKRAALSQPVRDLPILKALIDRAAAENAWLIITTHSGNSDDNGAYWDGQNSMNAIIELNQYALTAGCKVLKPRDAFQIFGNLIENDSGFRITADGRILTS